MKNDAPTDELLQLEKRFWQAMKDRDTDTCVALSADSCLVTGAQGVGSFTRQQMRDMMEQGGQYTLDDYELKDVQARMLGPDLGIVAYTVHQTLTVEGEPVAFDAADTSTWVRQNGTWCCALHSETVLGDPFGRDKTAKA